MRIRDSLELSVLTEFGDPDLAEMAGLVFEQIFDMLCTTLGIDPQPLTAFEDHMTREHGI